MTSQKDNLTKRWHLLAQLANLVLSLAQLSPSLFYIFVADCKINVGFNYCFLHYSADNINDLADHKQVLACSQKFIPKTNNLHKSLFAVILIISLSFVNSNQIYTSFNSLGKYPQHLLVSVQQIFRTSPLQFYQEHDSQE